jgi:glutaredoxin
MDYIEPSTDSYTVYTKSGCPNCTKVKKLLILNKEEPHIVDCDEYLIEDKPAFLEFIKTAAERDWTTFPIVFYKGTFLGGFSETEKFLERQTAFSEFDE